jgi:hypothetical protein
MLYIRDIYFMEATVEIWFRLIDGEDLTAIELVRRLGAVAPDTEEPLANSFSSEYGEEFLEQFEKSISQTQR